MTPQWAVFHGDALELLRTLPSESIDSIVTDPPAGISFMGREWDHHKGGRDQWVAWLTEITRECLRVLKPGGHALFWALPKTSHWTATAVEDGGFELRDVITHHFGQGFPKGKNQLKPASEHWILARHSGKGQMLNIDRCRIGFASEADRLSALPGSMPNASDSIGTFKTRDRSAENPQDHQNPSGRWPTNAVFTHSASCRLVGSEVVKANGGSVSGATALGQGSGWNKHNNRPTPIHREDETVPVYDCAPDCPVRVLDQQSGILVSGKGNFKGASSKGYQPSVYSTDNRPEGQQQVAYGDTGTASRFFPRFEWSGEHDDPFLYSGKASTKEREAGCENIPPAESGRHNDHNTVKPVALMRWLVRLVTPPGGVCLDIFCGSGTTGVACVLEGFHFMGFDAELRFVDISRARIGYWAGRR